MKNALLIVCVLAGFVSCKKDKFTSVPQIEFKDIKPNFLPEGVFKNDPNVPKLVLQVRDAEGDFGGTITDSSKIYITNLRSGNIDSIAFPNLDRAPKKDFDAEVEITLFDAMDCYTSAPPAPRYDTSYFEVYLKDQKGNKSNVIVTTKPAVRECN